VTDGGGRSDSELLHAHVRGDPDAFAELVARHRDRLWAVALRTLGDREDAADAVQDALLSAYRAAGRFRGDAAVTTWLHRIVVNACLDRVRRRQAHPTVPLPDGSRDRDGGRHGARGVEPATPPVDHDTALEVREALTRLPVEQRAALVLVDLQGYSVAEVAQILGVAEGTVKSRCARGRARLAIQLGHLRPTGSTTARPAPPTPTTRPASGAPTTRPTPSGQTPDAGAVTDGTPGNPTPGNPGSPGDVPTGSGTATARSEGS
jgi:RNA polymerase sigma-70 factor (ECF subfamily)